VLVAYPFFFVLNVSELITS